MGYVERVLLGMEILPVDQYSIAAACSPISSNFL